jgi:glucose 1-dehydrogenase
MVKKTTMNNLLKGQTALVTGGSEGIGQAIAVALGSVGVRVAINYHSHEQGANDTLAQIQKSGGDGFIIRADVGSEVDVLAMYAEVYKQFTDLDILISNAGIQKDSAFADMTLADWELVINTNLTGSFLCAREAVKGFIKKGVVPGRSAAAGKILFISSVHNIIPWAGHANYTTSKGGETMLMKTMAQDAGSTKDKGE